MEAQSINDGCILILYTTKYRTGGDKFTRAAEVLANEKRASNPSRTVIAKAVESKSDFKIEIEKATELQPLAELHFIGHSGLYGIMFGTTDWPEQFSPFEWRQLKIRFSKNARVFFHACRTGRWFAPFFARTFNVKTFGHFWYTTVSAKKDRFVWEGFSRTDQPVYIVSVAGKKSHGVLSSLSKYVMRPRNYELLSFDPPTDHIDRTYDSVAELYDETFEDITVRADELTWLRSQLKGMPTKTSTVLDIGCGTGSFLRAIEDLVERPHGVDLSAGMIGQARARASRLGSRAQFQQITGPLLPFDDDSFDVVTSILSFRYLDWDRIISEILRVLKPGGHLLVIDMVAKPIEWQKIPRFIIDKIRQQLMLLKNPRYRQALKKMVSSAGWKTMLLHNPMRAEHEYIWYFKSRFPNCKLEVINYAWNSRIIAFKSPPIDVKQVKALSYP